MSTDLTSRHRDTIDKIFRHPAGGNIKSHEVVSLLGQVGTLVEEHNGNFKTTLGTETEVLHGPQGKDIDAQMVTDLRRMLTGAKLAPGDLGL